jgi:hypothetical protein
MIKITSSLIVSILIWTTIAHPGANVAEEAWKRKVAVQDPERRTVEDCHAELEASGYFKRDVERRLERVNQLRAEKGSQPCVYHSMYRNAYPYKLTAVKLSDGS